MYKSGRMERLSVETVARYGNCLLQRLCPFVAFQMIQNNIKETMQNVRGKQ
jgi:hypothetical protein